MGNVQCNACNCRQPEKESEINEEIDGKQKNHKNNSDLSNQLEHQDYTYLPSKAKVANLHNANYINNSENNMESKEFGENTSSSVNLQDAKGKDEKENNTVGTSGNFNFQNSHPIPPSESGQPQVKRGSKIFTNLNNSKPPLEIINELNGELSKDSIRDNLDRNREKELLENQAMKTSVMKILEEKEKQIKGGLASPTHQNINYGSNMSEGSKFPKVNSENEVQNTIMSKIAANSIEANNMGIDSVIQIDYVSNLETNGSNRGNGKHTNTGNKFKKNTKLTVERGGNGKVVISKKTTPRNLSKFGPWKNITVTTIIPESKLLNSDNEEILFQGELFKYTPVSPAQHGAHPYSSKFCILTRTEFKAYRSKESFLRLQNPNYKIPFFNVILANNLNMDSARQTGHHKNKKYFHFLMELFPNSKDIRLYSFNENNNVSPKLKINFDVSISKIGNDSDTESGKNSKRWKKISMIDDKSESLIIKDLSPQNIENEIHNVNTNNPNMLIFASDSEEIINKWLCVINYFISK